MLSGLGILGCAGNSQLRNIPVKMSNGSSGLNLPKQSMTDEYLLGFGDVIEVKFFNNDRFNETVTVRPDGRISLERVGDIIVSGMTPSKLDSIITSSYSAFLITPDVTVFVREFGGYNVYVLGEVDTPGGYPIERNMTILQALAVAGGPKDGAQLKSIMILRQGDAGKLTATKYDAKAGLAGLQNNFTIQPQDIIYVPRTFISSVSNFLDQIYDGLLPPLEAYLRAVYWSRR